MNTARASVVLGIVVVSGMVVLTGAPIAGAQPELPASYYGEVVVDEGELSEPIEVAAVADGEVQDTIIVEEDGALGGGGVGEEKLEVQPPDDTDVSFHVDGEPVTILEHDGEAIDGETIEFESGPQEIVLEVDADTPVPIFDVSVTEAPTSVTAGDDVTIEAQIENIGQAEGTQTVGLLTPDDTIADETNISLAEGDSVTTELAWTTTSDDVTDEEPATVTVQSEDTNDTAAVTIEAAGAGQPVAPQPDPPEPDPDPGDIVSLPSGASATAAEEQSIVTNESLGMSQVRFSEGFPVQAISWDDPSLSGDVGVAVLNETPDDVAPIAGMELQTFFIEVPTDIQDEPAVVDIAVSEEARTDADISEREHLHLARNPHGDQWEVLDTRLYETTATETLLQSDVDGFSYFGVTATTEPTADITVESDTPQVGEEISFSATANDEYGEIIDYEWAVDETTGSGESFTMTPEEDGDYEVTLTVENDAGLTTSVTETVTVEDDDDGLPGFGIGMAVVALLLAAIGLGARAGYVSR